jgi:predicted TIM-barrel fold metal-dependent hydrolase
MDFLCENFASGEVRALRIMPTVSRFPVRQLERVLSKLEQFAPLVLWDTETFTDENDIQGIEYLTKKMPKINFALTQKMWPGFGSLLDLMWRCPNVYVDISWLHMRDTIELLRDEFGAERVLFGIGYKSHYGAAAAMLAHARITDEERELIAHGNIERLLKLSPLDKKLAQKSDLLHQKPLWEKFSSGVSLDDIEIIDVHGHDGPHTRGWILREGTISEIVKQMDRLGVNKLILSGERALFGDAVEGNLKVEKDAETFKGRIAGYLGFNPLYSEKLVPLFDDFFSRDFYVGFKLLASYWKVPLTDEVYKPVWEYANKHRLPILLHTWNDKYNSPAMLKEIVKKYPQAFFILGHSGGGTSGRLEAEELAVKNKNIYLEFCGTFTTPLSFESSAEKVGWDRVLFGSDTGAHSEAWELGRFLSMPVPDEALRPALAGNIKNILGEKQ